MWINSCVQEIININNIDIIFLLPSFLHRERERERTFSFILPSPTKIFSTNPLARKNIVVYKICRDLRSPIISIEPGIFNTFIVPQLGFPLPRARGRALFISPRDFCRPPRSEPSAGRSTCPCATAGTGVRRARQQSRGKVQRPSVTSPRISRALQQRELRWIRETVSLKTEGEKQRCKHI